MLEKNALKDIDTSHYYVVGAGAIGQLWATRLAKTGVATSFITRRVAKTIRVTELLVNERCTSQSDFSAYQAADINPVKMHKATVFICTKAYDAVQALTDILPALHPTSTIVALCNGVGMQQDMLQLLKNNQLNCELYWGVSSDGALIDSNQCFQHTGRGTTQIGCLTKLDHINHKLLLPENFALSVEQAIDIKIAIWKKFFINCAINPTTALFNCTNGELLNNAAFRSFFYELCDELQFLYEQLRKEFSSEVNNTSASGLQCNLPQNFSVLESSCHVAQNTSNNISSMLRDKRNNNTTEIGSLNAYLVAWAKQRNLPCMRNQQLVENVMQTPLRS